MHALLDAVRSGAGDDQIEGVEVVARAALAATATDVLDADGYLLGTPANLGSMSGALKHFFDQIYYPCLEDTVGPAATACSSTATTTPPGRCATVETHRHRPALDLGPAGAQRHRRPPTRADLDAAWELGAATAALLAEGLA